MPTPTLQQHLTHRVDIERVTTTSERFGDSWRPEAALPNTSVQIRIALAIHPEDKRSDARQILGRMCHANRSSDVPPLLNHEEDLVLDDGTRPRRRQAVATMHVYDHVQADVAVEHALHYADALRDRAFDVPTVDVDTARRMAALGVALRSDGLFGYKKRCAYEPCKNTAGDDCHAHLDPVVACNNAEQRASICCSSECWMDAGWGQTAGVGDWLKEAMNETGGTIERPEVVDALLACGAAFHDGSQYDLVADWWSLAKHHPAARHFVLDACAEVQEGMDGPDPDDDAVECEL